MIDNIPYSISIAEHFRRPRNYGPLPNATAQAEGVNPLCGDRIRIFVILDAEGRLTAARFTANACAICVASASLLTEQLPGKSRAAIAGMREEELLALVGGGVPVARRRCATLPLEALRRALASVPRDQESGARAPR
jgi:nitrogen fixation NifU-like protein